MPISRPHRTVALAFLLALSAGAAVSTPAFAATTFTVNRNGDASDRNITNSVCDVSTTSGNQCTLRAAIQEANDTGGQITINFNITSASKVITPASPLPVINRTVTINGYSQSGAHANTKVVGNDSVLKIVLDGINAGAGAVGLEVNGTGSIIKGLVIQRFDGAGIKVTAYKVDVFGNHIGTTADGLTARGNGVGVRVTASQIDLGTALPADRNLISGNETDGVLIEGGSASFGLIYGNYIGTKKGGAAALPNGENGVHIVDATNARVGGTAAGAGNVISGNGGHGVLVFKESGASDAYVQGNLIGTNASGTADLGNADAGVYTDALSVLVGGTATGARNVISGNGDAAVYLDGSDSNTIQGNLMGTKSDGTGSIPNSDGVTLVGFADDNTIGGSTNPATNLIANSQFDGILLVAGIHNTIERNVIRSNALTGFLIGDAVQTVTANLIFANGQDGVRVAGNTTSAVRMSANQIYANGQLGIDLGGGVEDSYGVTPNDANDTDLGPNGLQNTPVLTSAVRLSNGLTNLSGSLDSQASTQFRIEVFIAVVDGSGHGEGQIFVATQNVTTNAAGDVSFSIPIAQLSAGMTLTTTVTPVTSGSTSEFSNNIVVVAAP